MSLFGSTSTWGQNNNNNQQQQGTGFGTGGFGSTTNTGGFGAFGQPQQPQQPAANPMFGSFGGAPATNTANTGGGFGGFGATQNQGTSAFGAKPSGFGAFGGGGTSAFGGGGGGTSAFGGGAPAGGSTFGSTNTGSAFGSTSGGGLFGAKPATGAFGAFGGGASSQPATGPVANGSSDPPYVAYQEKDGSATLSYQAISAMPQYRGTSFEEIRVQDYAQNRKTPTAGGGTGFGQSAFGAAAQPAGGAFGASQPAQQTSAFGSTTGGFGSTGSAFGGGGAFGTQNQQQPASTGFGGFGQTQPQQQSTGFGGFGQSQPAAPATGGGLFGGGGAFGSTANNQAKPGGFGSFGSTATNTGSAFGGGTSAFGQPQQPATGGGLFGATNNNAQQQPSTGFGGFGNNQQNQNKSLFGGTSTGTGFGATSGGGLFGSTQPQQNQQTNTNTGGGLFGGGNAGGGLFGANNNQQQNQPATGGGLFGNTNNNQQQGTGGGGLFGGGGGGGGLFGGGGQNNQNSQQQSSAFGGGLFGAKPAQPNQPSGGGLFGGGTGSGGGGLFGSTNNNQQTNTGGGLFGGLGQSANNQQQNQGNSLFGQKPAQAPMGQSTSGGGGLFGGGGSLFGNSTNTLAQSQAPPQQTLTASINEPIGVNLPIFSMLPPGPRAVDIDLPKKKPSFFVDVPTRTPVPRLQLSYQPAQSKLRGFSSINGSQLGMSLANGKSSALSLSQSPTKSVGPDMFLNGSGPQFGSGSRRSVKKLVLDKKIEPQDLFHKTGSASPSPQPKITFDPALSRAAREREYAEETAGRPIEPPVPAKQRTTPRFTAAAADDGVAEGEYWTKPDVSVLKHKSHAELSAFPDLVVGRAGFGEIHFLEPVDLTGLVRLTDLLGEVVRFDEKECSVYPDVDDDDKPPMGQGLNVRAQISLVHCWALDKATREPIKDPKHPQVVKHVKKLAAMKDTHFVGFDHADGKWTFTVDHF